MNSLKLEGAGMQAPEHDLGNYRIRGIVKNNENRYIYLEFGIGHRFSLKDTKLPKKEYEEKYPYQDYLRLDHCFYLDVPVDYYNNHSDDLRHLERKGLYQIPYTKEAVLNFINENLDCSYDDINVIYGKEYSAHDEIKEMGFIKDQYDNEIGNYSKIKCLLVRPEELPKEIEIPNTLKAKQEQVHGLIELCHLVDDEEVCLICNEEGKMIGLEPNRDIGHDIIFGNFLIIGDDYKNGDFKSLTDEQIKKYQDHFNEKSVKETKEKINSILGYDL